MDCLWVWLNFFEPEVGSRFKDAYLYVISVFFKHATGLIIKFKILKLMGEISGK
jgi:hypothetical protein